MQREHFKQFIIIFIFLTSILIPTQQAFSSNLYLIIVADTQNSQIGKACKIDLEKIHETFKKVSSFTKLKLNPTIFCDDSLNADSVKTFCNTIQIENTDDVIVFYFSGHGVHNGPNDDIWPIMLMNEDNWEGLRQYEIFKILVNKNPRLLLVISDSCNNIIPEINNVMKLKNLPDLIRLKKLFLSFNGYIIVSGSKPGRDVNEGFSLCDNYEGGYFTSQFIDAMEKYATWYVSSSTWNDILREGCKPITKEPYTQQPQGQIYIKENNELKLIYDSTKEDKTEKKSKFDIFELD